LCLEAFAVIKKQLLVVPRIVNQVGDWYQFPLGIAYISSSLKKAGFSVYNLNLNNIEGSAYEILSDLIIDNNIDILSTGGLTGQYGAIKDIMECAKTIKPSIITIVGGGIISSAPEYAMIALEFADYGVIGEGENIICELTAALENSTSIKDVPGVIYKNGLNYMVNNGKPEPVALDNIPIPDYEGFGLDKLLSTVPNIIGLCEYNTLPIITSRSCPYKCTFCFHPSGPKYRQRSLDSVFNEIDSLVQKYGVKYLSIQDELFGYNVDRIIKFCSRIKKYNINWLAQFRVTDITPELVSLLKDSNCSTIGFGIESAHNDILKSMKKQITIEQTNKALELVYNAGIGIQGVLIFGDKAETIETATTSLNWWKEHIHYEIQLSAIITYPGTELYKYALSKGIIKDPVQFIKDGCPLIRLSGMTDDQYSWLFDQLASLPRLTHKTPTNSKITYIDYQNASIDVTGNCVTCNDSNNWDKVRLFILETLQCRNCGARHIATIPDEVVNRVSINLNRLVCKFGNIALWGINSYIYALAEMLNIDYKEHIYFVDKSVMRQGLNVAGNSIMDPIIIKEKSIKCVVVLVVQYYAGLIKPIEDEYQTVEHVISISQLLSDDILCNIK
jgi:anaerobic magnesium-protoporphyrin IX monomethyl ester cyclase